MVTELDQRLAAGDVPLALRTVLMPFTWRLEMLRALDLELTEIKVSTFDWMLDLPMWRYDGEWFAVTPRQVTQDREKYREQWDRTQHADLTCPVYVTPRAGRLVIIDGLHRLLRATGERVERLLSLIHI